MQKYLFIVHFSSHSSTYQLDHMKETKESRNRDPYLTVAARKPAVQVRKETNSNLQRTYQSSGGQDLPSAKGVFTKCTSHLGPCS